MRVLFGLCCCIAVASAGLFAYPQLPFGYDGRFAYSINHPVTSFTTVSQAFPTTLNGICDLPLNLNTPLFPQPPGVIIQGPPAFVQILPLPPVNITQPDNCNGNGNGNGGGNGDGTDGNDTSEETTPIPSNEVENRINRTVNL